jgi:hypothetical protein
MRASTRTAILVASAAGLVAVAAVARQFTPAPAAMTQPAKLAAPLTPLTEVASATCEGGKVDPGKADPGNPAARKAAQRGLDYLATDTVAWTKQHDCFGCHVHAVTLEAFTVGKRNQYEIQKAPMQTVLAAMLTGPGGTRTSTGLVYAHGGSLQAPSKAFGGAAFARYDQWIDASLRDDLLKVAGELLTYQQPDGSIQLSWTNPPVGAGTIQGTFQAAQTWRQAYARTADDRWLVPLRKAEGYLTAQAKAWRDQPTASLQDLDYAIMGLTAAGVGGGEDIVRTLSKQVLARQAEDGGWALSEGEGSSAFATGQALYALRMTGLTDRDPALARGVTWLIEHQLEDGAWSHAGRGKAEAMWGVLGLVSVDVLTVSVDGLEDGTRARGTQTVRVQARDNDPTGGGVTKVELYVDDLRVHSACGPSLGYDLDATRLGTGLHLVDAVAWNARGQKSTRRLEVYAGDVYLSQVGTRANESATVVTVRNLAGADERGKVELEILAEDGKTAIARVSAAGTPGAMALEWDGKTSAGTMAPSARYQARLVYRDAAGKELQAEPLSFVRASEEVQARDYAEVEGALNLPAGTSAVNTLVELVDDDGKVQAVTRSTGSGQYRFKGVAEGKYKVRVAKEGFAAPEMPVDATPAKQNKADFALEARKK